MLAEQIFNAMLNSPNYFRIVYPFLDSEYFTEKHNKKIYQYFKNFYESHKSIPFCADLAVAAEGDISLSEEETKQIFTKINELKVFDGAKAGKYSYLVFSLSSHGTLLSRPCRLHARAGDSCSFKGGGFGR